MLKASLKWMIGVLLVFALILASVILFVRAFNPYTPTEVMAEPSPSPAAEARPSPEPTASAAPSPEPVSSLDPPEDTPAFADEETIRLYVSQMTIQDKIGQLVMFGFTGQTTPTQVFREMIAEYHLGNFVLYGLNIANTDEDGGFEKASILTNRLRKLNKTEIPPLISIDIEGGKVLRFNWIHPPVSARRLGRANDYDRAYKQFLTIGRTLKDVGINMNLAPVLDISKDPMSTMFETRIISSNPDIAAKIGRAVVAGLNDASCLSTAKHFPGHGETKEDSHDTTPVIYKTLEEMDAYDLIPFQECIEAGIDNVLVAHILYPKLDPDDIASMSSYIITDLLRNEYGHSGIVMSDDFRMAGVTSRYDVSEAAVKFILAGGDLILCGPRHDLQKAILKGLSDAIDEGVLTEERIDQSVVRILTKKQKVTGWIPVPAPEPAP